MTWRSHLIGISVICCRLRHELSVCVFVDTVLVFGWFTLIVHLDPLESEDIAEMKIVLISHQVLFLVQTLRLLLLRELSQPRKGLLLIPAEQLPSQILNPLLIPFEIYLHTAR